MPKAVGGWVALQFEAVEAKMSNAKFVIPPFDQQAAEAARARQAQLTKPAGSLGRLEELAVQLAGITGKVTPEILHKSIIIMAADHGVTAEGVSAYPSEVTAQMVLNFLRGGAAISVLARFTGSRLTVVDVGVASDLPDANGLLKRKIAAGTRNMVQEPAMTREQAWQALEVGVEVVEEEVEQGLDILVLGEMGIGNTTAAAAVACALGGFRAEEIVGRGTGVDEAGWQRKVQAVKRALARANPDPEDPIGVLAEVGGFEIGGLAGAMLAAASHRVPVLVDGFIATSAAMLAAALAPEVRHYFIAAHRSEEQGHGQMLAFLGLRPLLDLGLRLGEGSGAALALPLVEAAAQLHAHMATFAEAGVAERED